MQNGLYSNISVAIHFRHSEVYSIRDCDKHTMLIGYTLLFIVNELDVLLLNLSQKLCHLFSFQQHFKYTRKTLLCLRQINFDFFCVFTCYKRGLPRYHFKPIICYTSRIINSEFIYTKIAVAF